jgi:hypothetical protein
MIKQALYEVAILACIIFSSGVSVAVPCNLFVLNTFNRK